MSVPLRPLNPILHALYTPLYPPHGCRRDPLPAETRAAVEALVLERGSADESRLDGIDRALVAHLWPWALRPDEIARGALHPHPRRRVIDTEMATRILAAIGEAGYPITGNGAPDYEDYAGYAPVRGPERDRVIWAAARYWAEMASQELTYVSLGDARGYLPRPVQYGTPEEMHPRQHAALTLGPADDRGDEWDTTAYMQRHTRLLLLVRTCAVGDHMPVVEGGIE